MVANISATIRFHKFIQIDRKSVGLEGHRVRLSQSIGYERNVKSKLLAFAEFADNDTPLCGINLDLLNRFKRKGRAWHAAHLLCPNQTNDAGAMKQEIIQKGPFLHFEMPAPRLKLTDIQQA